MTPVGVESPVGTQKAGGFSALPSGVDPKTEQQTEGADPRTGNVKGETYFCPGVLALSCPGGFAVA